VATVAISNLSASPMLIALKRDPHHRLQSGRFLENVKGALYPGESRLLRRVDVAL
jgi:hypothetical protein